MTIRLQCIVPGCNHTRGQRKGEPPLHPDMEWICGEHWRLVPAYMQRRKNACWTRYRRAFGTEPYWSFPAGSPKRLLAVRLDRMRRRAWELCRRAAIERGVGI